MVKDRGFYARPVIITSSFAPVGMYLLCSQVQVAQPHFLVLNDLFSGA